MRATVLIADDEPLLRTALADLLSAEEEFTVVGVVGDANEAVLLAAEAKPDLAIVDVRMPGGGATAARGIRDCSPNTRVVAFSAYHERWAVVEMVRAGAVGYLVKGSRSGPLVAALKELAHGRTQLDPAAAAQLLEELGDRLRSSEARDTQREHRYGRIRAVLDDPDRIGIALQPVFDIRRMEIVGVEALARFRGPDDWSADGPASWFADAESVGLAVDLELTVLGKAVASAAILPAHWCLFLNTSPAVLHSAALPGVLHGAGCRDLVVEITEHAPVTDYDSLAAALAPLRARGLRLAVDDAGSGFASLRHILRLAPDVVKLDAELTRGVDESGPQRTLAKGLLAFATELGALVVAEGIETPSELQTLQALGVGGGQGFHLGRPQLPPYPFAAPTT